MPLISAVLLAAAVAAPQAAPAAGSPYQLTAEQVRKCGAIALDRSQRIAELARQDKDLLAEQTTLQARQAELTAMAAKVNTKKPKEVAAYNAASAEFNAAMPAEHEKIVARNAYAATIDPLGEVYNRDCSHKSMNPADVAALPDEQRVLISAGAKTSTIMVPAPPPAPAKRRPRP